MTNDQIQKYRRDWQKKNVIRMRVIRLRHYYKHRKIINLMFSRPTSILPDAADIHYLEIHPNG